MWAIEHLDSSDINHNVNQLLLNIVRDADPYLSYETLKWIDANTISMQQQLWEVFTEVSVLKKRDVMDKLLAYKIEGQVLLEATNYLPVSNNPIERLLIKKLINQNKP
jgi:hypothetical protein